MVPVPRTSVMLSKWVGRKLFEALGSYATVPVEPKAKRYDNFCLTQPVVSSGACVGNSMKVVGVIIPRRKNRYSEIIEKYIAPKN